MYANLNTTEQLLIPSEGSNRRFIIPSYQRSYKWKKEQVSQLVDDILNINRNQISKHFIGYLILKEDNIPGSKLEPKEKIDFILIDGQQRLTTLFLIIKALETFDNNIEKDKYKEILFIKNNSLRLQLNPKDNIVFNQILTDDNIDDKTSFIFKSYLLIKKKLEKYKSNNSDFSSQAILKNIKKHLYFIACDIDHEEDPQTIFERMNSTQLELEPYELIQNFLLMSLSKQEMESYYSNYWNKIAQELKNEELFSQFINHFLIYKLKEKVSKTEVYYKFKSYVNSNNIEKTDILKELKELFEIYKYFVLDKDYKNPKINVVIKELKQLGVNVVWPLILKFLNDFKKYNIDEEDIKKSIQLIKNFIVRVSITYPSKIKNFNLFFATFYKNAFKNIKLDEHNYYDIVSSYIQSPANEFMNFPLDDDFKNALINNPLYFKRNNKLCMAILTSIENYQSKEPINFATSTIEHIMPRKETPEWKKEIGENDYDQVWNKYLNTIGNLTLTGYNSELSNKPFADKKRKLKEVNTKIAILQEDIFNSDRWNKEAIIKRANNLSNRALQIFAFYPPKKPIDYAKKELIKFTLYNYSEYIHLIKKYVHFKIYGYEKEYNRTVAKLYSTIFEYCYKSNPKKMLEMAMKNFSFGKTGTNIDVTNNIKNIKKTRTKFEIPNSKIHVYSNYDNQRKLKNLRILMKHFNLDPEDILIEIPNTNSND